MRNYNSLRSFPCDIWEHPEGHSADSTASTIQRYLLEQYQAVVTTSQVETEDLATHMNYEHNGVNRSYQGMQDSYARPRRDASPSSSGLESPGISSGGSDRQGSPWSSLDTSNLPYPTDPIGAHGIDRADLPYVGQHDLFHGTGCVAMNDVQKFADHQK